MKKLALLPSLLIALLVVSCSTTKTTTASKMNLKGKVESVKSMKIIDVAKADNNSEQKEVKKVFLDAVTMLQRNDVFKHFASTDSDSIIRVFDTDGNIISEWDYNCNGAVVYNTIFKRQGGLLVREEKYDTKQKLCNSKDFFYDGKDLKKIIMNSVDDTIVVQFARNKDGQVVSAAGFDKNNDMTSVRIKNYENGRLEKEWWYVMKDNNKCFVDYKYVGDNIVEKKSISKSEQYSKVKTKEDLDVFENGKLVRASRKFTTKIDKTTDMEYAKFKEMFDKEMAKLEGEDKKQEVKPVKQIEIRKDKKEEIRKLKKEEIKKAPQDTDDYENFYVFSYNEFDDVVKITCTFNSYRAEKDYEFGIAYEYDDNNNWTIMTVNYNGKPIMVKEREVKYY